MAPTPTSSTENNGRKGGMSSAQPLTSSGSEGDPQYAGVDERKRKRMLSNRESARRSRQRKQKHLDDMIGQVSELQKQNCVIAQKTETTLQRYNQVESENQVLRARMAELNDRLEYLNSFLGFMEDTGDLFMNTPEVSDPLLKPWQLPCQSQPIMASSDMGPMFF
ncbi:bZIP transcription factor 53-like [Telopea speciosissima]|uniref:bZIP transcription factor 53-like n=1 Tax=Telopea speciosissima TaxID=54955 RepID=UPI001CC4348A|nr:bZIP transcription factor 53-like [Telopea speciosissima]